MLFFLDMHSQLLSGNRFFFPVISLSYIILSLSSLSVSLFYLLPLSPSPRPLPARRSVSPPPSPPSVISRCTTRRTMTRSTTSSRTWARGWVPSPPPVRRHQGGCQLRFALICVSIFFVYMFFSLSYIFLSIHQCTYSLVSSYARFLFVSARRRVFFFHSVFARSFVFPVFSLSSLVSENKVLPRFACWPSRAHTHAGSVVAYGKLAGSLSSNALQLPMRDQVHSCDDDDTHDTLPFCCIVNYS